MNTTHVPAQRAAQTEITPAQARCRYQELGACAAVCTLYRSAATAASEGQLVDHLVDAPPLPSTAVRTDRPDQWVVTLGASSLRDAAQEADNAVDGGQTCMACERPEARATTARALAAANVLAVKIEAEPLAA